MKLGGYRIGFPDKGVVLDFPGWAYGPVDGYLGLEIFEIGSPFEVFIEHVVHIYFFSGDRAAFGLVPDHGVGAVACRGSEPKSRGFPIVVDEVTE